MAKTAKITEIWKSYSFESKYGTRYNIKIKLDDGVEWSIIKEKEDALKVWDEITYETTEDDYGVHIKQIQQKKWNGWSKNSDKALFICKAMECAVRMVACGDTEKKDLEKSFNRFYDIMSKKNGQ